MSLYEERKRLEQEDGEPLHTLRLMPDGEVATRCHGAGVLVVAGEWGVTKSVEDTLVRPLAEMGYFVVAIDLVRGEKPASDEEAAARRAAVDPEVAIISAKVPDPELVPDLESGKAIVLDLRVDSAFVASTAPARRSSRAGSNITRTWLRDCARPDLGDRDAALPDGDGLPPCGRVAADRGVE